MIRPRDRASAAGLLPRMEARPRKDGLTTYRFHPLDGKPITLGTDRAAKIAQHWTHPDTLRLHAGEMTAQELRTVVAVLNGVTAAIRAETQ